MASFQTLLEASGLWFRFWLAARAKGHQGVPRKKKKIFFSFFSPGNETVHRGGREKEENPFGSLQALPSVSTSLPGQGPPRGPKGEKKIFFFLFFHRRKRQCTEGRERKKENPLRSLRTLSSVSTSLLGQGSQRVPREKKNFFFSFFSSGKDRVHRGIEKTFILHYPNLLRIKVRIFFLGSARRVGKSLP